MDDKTYENTFDVEKKQVDVFSAKCDKCGANLVFNPEKGCLYCEHCGATKDFKSSGEVAELQIKDAFLNAEQWSDDSVAYRCENCGAIVIVDGKDTATLCPYCGTGHVKEIEGEKGLKPGVLYPFTISGDTAVSKAREWCKKRIFAPRKFKKSFTVDNMKGVYEPCYTFDSDTYSTYEGRLGKTVTRTVGSGKDRRTVTTTEYFRVSGTYSHFFDDVFINASTSYDRKTFNKIAPFNYETIKGYDKRYLSGFMAHRSEKKIDDAWDEAKSDMDSKLRRLILSQYAYDTVSYLNVSTVHNNVTYKYVLVPVYLLNYNYAKSNYKVYVNGNTGKVTGKTPLSWLRIGFAVLLGLAAATGLVYLIQNFL